MNAQLLPDISFETDGYAAAQFQRQAANRDRMNPQSPSIILFAVLFGMVIAWFVLIKLLLNRLEVAHPQKYESMGRPALFLRNNIATGWATTKFLLGRQYRFLNDSYLSKLSHIMLVFSVIYLLLFFGLSFFIVTGPHAV